jgi:very-short-patch-repair endonuclease
LSISEVDPKLLKETREELETGGYRPRDEASAGFLRSLVQRLSPRGEFQPSGPIPVRTEHPTVGRDPVFFLRARTLGFAAALEAVLEDLQRDQTVPPSLLTVVGVEAPSAENGSSERDDSPDANEILFSKPANPEQHRIAERLARSGAVLVQGPPGTGKTHTIANLIGHLLAHGKTVLVTAHTTKALRVLRDHVVEPLRPLCVSLLDNDLESRKQLQESVERIVEKLSQSDLVRLEAAAMKLQIERARLIAECALVRKRLIDARGDEYRDIIVAGEGYGPAQAARHVAQHRGRDGWIPGPLAPGEPLPIADGDVAYLYETNEIVSADDEAELEHDVPDPADLIAPDEFARFAEMRTQLLAAAAHPGDFWNREPDAADADRLERLVAQLQHAVAQLSDGGAWRLAAAAAGHAGSARDPWELLLRMIKDTEGLAVRSQEGILRYAPRLSATIPPVEQKRIAEELYQHASSRGRVGRLALWTHPAWARFVGEVQVNGRAPVEPEHFRALADAAALQHARTELRERWGRQMAPLGAPAPEQLGEHVERACSQYAPLIEECLDWYVHVWEPLRQELCGLGFQWERFLNQQPPRLVPYGDLVRLRDAISGPLPAELRRRVHGAKLEQLERTKNERLSKLARRPALHQAVVAENLAKAIARWDADAYRTGFARLVELHSRRAILERRNRLLNQLEAAAPAWVRAIRTRSGAHGASTAPGDATAAWLWRQLSDELDRRGHTPLQLLQQRSAELTEQLEAVTTELIDHRAWAGQVRRTTLTQRKALVGWLDTIRKIGKGYGIRVPRLRAEASRLMVDARTAVPVWIMPLSRVAENFDPRRTRFDVVILDEASQSDVMALLAFYLGRETVVVGDQEQVSPSAVGQELKVVQRLIDEHLHGIPNAHLYDGQTSVYDLARQSFPGTVVLLEHFRCVREIIQFSNWLSYGGRIKPLRDESRVLLKPHVIAYRVDGSSDRKVNAEEALTIASLAVAAAEQPEYDGATFGVISLVGEEQALEIERLLLHYMPPEEHERRRVLCGTAAQFQGDERDVVFLSVVDSPGDGPLALREQPMFKQRFNVAASRARDQMWVVHSLDPRRDLKDGDLRRRLIEHAEDPLALVRMLEQGEARAESPFERDVLHRLVAAGYRVHCQWKVGYYRIDLVVDDGERRLAVECDGDRFHPLESLPDDMVREATLRRLGWKFVRVRGSEFYRDPDAAMRPVWETLRRLGIRAVGSGPSSSAPEAEGREALSERVIRRAAELRRAWTEQDDDGPPLSPTVLDAPPPASSPPASARPMAPPSPRSQLRPELEGRGEPVPLLGGTEEGVLSPVENSEGATPGASVRRR